MFRPAGNASVAQRVQNEGSNPAGLQRLSMLLLKGGRFHVPALGRRWKDPAILLAGGLAHLQVCPDARRSGYPTPGTLALAGVNVDCVVSEVAAERKRKHSSARRAQSIRMLVTSRRRYASGVLGSWPRTTARMPFSAAW